MAAKSDTLGSLHELFAAYWHEQMTRTAPQYNADGEVVGEVKVPLSAAEAAVLRAFLKDNNVQADPSDDHDIKDLSKQLRAATSGTVDTTELDGILDDFMKATPGLRNTMQ